MRSSASSKNSEEAENKPSDLITALNALRTWFRRLLVGGVIAFCSSLLVAVGLYYYQREYNKEEKIQQEQGRIERSQEACRQDNRQTKKTREYSEEQLVQIFSIFSSADIDPEEVRTRFEQEFEEYSSFVNQTFQYRDCSKECVIAYFEEVPDCPAPKDYPD